MTEKGTPGALGCATGAGNAFQAAAGGTQNIARKGGKGTPYRLTPSAGECAGRSDLGAE